ncbi:MAG: hypothetical protein MJ234_00930, partial [bacterium]|nr:hypothetical protein [bacterium]
MEFKYSDDVIKKEMWTGGFICAVSMLLLLIFVCANFHWGVFQKATSLVAIRHSGTIQFFWFAIIAVGLLVFWGGPLLAAAINRKTLRYAVSSSGITVINIYDARAVIRWRDIIKITETLQSVVITSETNKIIIYKDMNMFEKFYSFVLSHVPKKASKDIKNSEAVEPSASERKNETKKELKKDTRALLSKILENDAKKAGQKMGGDVVQEQPVADLLKQAKPAVSSVADSSDKASKSADSSTGKSSKKPEKTSKGEKKGKLLDAFLNGSADEEGTKLSKSTMVMSKSAFKELTKRAAKRSRKPVNTDESAVSSDSADSSTEEQPKPVIKPSGRLRSRVDTSTLSLKDKSSILLSAIGGDEEEKKAEQESQVKFSLETLQASDVKAVSDSQKEDSSKEDEASKERKKEQKKKLISDFLTQSSEDNNESAIAVAMGKTEALAARRAEAEKALAAAKKKAEDAKKALEEMKKKVAAASSSSDKKESSSPFASESSSAFVSPSEDAPSPFASESSSAFVSPSEDVPSPFASESSSSFVSPSEDVPSPFASESSSSFVSPSEDVPSPFASESSSSFVSPSEDVPSPFASESSS